MKTIEVIPNPYLGGLGLDKDGVPQGVFPHPDGFPGHFVGAGVDAIATRKTGKNRYYYPLGSKRDEKGKRIGDGTGTVKVPFTAEVAQAVREGTLFAATIEGYLLCALGRPEGFLPAEKLLAKAKEEAEAYWLSLHLEKKPVADIPRTMTEDDPADPAPPETVSRQITPTVKLTKNTEA